MFMKTDLKGMLFLGLCSKFFSPLKCTSEDAKLRAWPGRKSPQL